MSGDDDDDDDQRDRGGHIAEGQTVVDGVEEICDAEEVTDILAEVETVGVEGMHVEDEKVVLADDGIGREDASHLSVRHENNHEQEAMLYLVDDESEILEPLHGYDVCVYGGDARRNVDVGDDVGDIRKYVVEKKLVAVSGLVAGPDIFVRLHRQTLLSYSLGKGGLYCYFEE